MKIVISAAGDSLDSMMDPQFGRAAYFLFVDSDTLAYQSFINPNVEAPGGAGIQSAQFVLEKGAQAVITGSCGPNAYRVLTEAGIPIIEASVKSVREQVQAFKENFLPNSAASLNANSDTLVQRNNRGNQQPAPASTDSLNPQAENFQEKNIPIRKINTENSVAFGSPRQREKNIRKFLLKKKGMK